MYWDGNLWSSQSVLVSGILEPVLYKMNMTAVSNFAGKNREFKKYPVALASFLNTRHKKLYDNLSGYLFYRWSIRHYSLILSELLFLFRFIHEPNSFMDIHKCTILLIALIIFIFAFLLTLIMYLTEKVLYNSLNDA